MSRGKGGSVFRIKPEDIKIIEKANVDNEKYNKESSLYEPFLSTINDKYTKDLNIIQFVIQKTAYAGKKRTGGVWTRPDVTLIAVQSYPYYPTKSMEIIAFEIKHFTDFNVVAVYETAAHTRFANKSYLSVYFPKNMEKIITGADMDRIQGECERFNVGLLLFSDPRDFDTFDFVLEPERGKPDPADQNEFVSKQIDEKRKQILLTLFK